jgi:predicted Rossmann-fold nucleotide-binding protein
LEQEKKSPELHSVAGGKNADAGQLDLDRLLALPELQTEAALEKLGQSYGDLCTSIEPPMEFIVVVMGSARVPPEHRIFIETEEMAYQIARHGPIIGTGGGPGIMTAANSGAMRASKENPATSSRAVCLVNIHRAEPPNPFIHHSYPPHKIIHTRLGKLLRLAHFGAVILAEAGGYGTDHEKTGAHQLRQFGQLNVPVIGIGPMWKARQEWEQKWIIEPEWADESDLDLVTVVPTAMDAVPIVLRAYERFRQMRAAG